MMKTILGFVYVEPFWIAAPECEQFKPIGLAIWGAPKGSTVAACILGNSREILASRDPIPARFFGTFRSFEAIAKAMARGEEPMPGWPSFSTLIRGQGLRIHLLGPRGVHLEPDGIELAVWGKSLG